MTDEFLKQMEDKLYAIKKEIIEELKSENEELYDIITDKDPKDTVDLAAGDIDKSVIETLGKQQLLKLQKIEAAIARIKTGHFGKCLKCGEKISKERIEAIPYAVFCIGCQSSGERR